MNADEDPMQHDNASINRNQNSSSRRFVVVLVVLVANQDIVAVSNLVSEGPILSVCCRFPLLDLRRMYCIPATSLFTISKGPGYSVSLMFMPDFGSPERTNGINSISESINQKLECPN